MITSTMFANGIVKNNDGKILGYYDADCCVVYINGRVNGITANDAKVAHEIIADFFSLGMVAA